MTAINTENSSLTEKISLLPKAELHVHIEGTLEPDLVFALAHKNNVVLPFDSPEQLARAYQFTDLDGFLRLYYACAQVLRDYEDFYQLMESYLRKAHAQGVVHAEIFCDPQTHWAHGVDPHTVLDGLLDGFTHVAAELGMTGGLIMCFLRHESPESADQLLHHVAPRIPELLGVGLDSSELNFPPHIFTQVFAQARQLGAHVVAHAGEEAPASYIWEALELLHAERIDHGIACVSDPHLVDVLQKRRIPLTVCPSSNVFLHVVDSWQEHPLVEMLRQGLVVTVNSDDPAYFGGYVTDNLVRLVEEFHLDDSTLALLARNSVEASFASPSRKNELYTQIERWQSTYGGVAS